MSVVLVGLFVSESTETILSGYIVSDSIALVLSDKCNFRPGIRTKSEALAYSQRCYDAYSGTDGCNAFYNQSIGYNQSLDETCS